MSDIVEEVNLVVENFEATYGVGLSAWKMLKSEVESIGRTDGDYELDEDEEYIRATAKGAFGREG